MLVKSIRGSIKYSATVYEEGNIFEIKDEDFAQLQENVEIVPEDNKTEKVDREDKDNADKTDKGKKSLKDTQESEKGSKDNDEVSAQESDSDDKEEIDYKSLKKSELIELAKERGIEIPDKATNDKIIELLEGK